jgi:phage gpG-like protein
VDAEEKAFKPYSTRHAAKRASLGLPIDHVDLFFTGSMLSSMTSETAVNQVRVFFMPTSDKFGGFNPAKALFLNEGGPKMPQREFFAISEKDASDIIDLTARRLQQLLDTGGKV